MIKLNDIKVSVDYTDSEIKKAVAEKLKVNLSAVKSFEILRRSIDARYKNVRFSLSVFADVTGIHKEDAAAKKADISDFRQKAKTLDDRSVIIGAGPAGMFAALVLAEHGCRPILIERGQPIEQRKKEILHFHLTGQLNTESNVCFGEGGAGTFSDGKLVTRVNDALCFYVLKTFVDNGASDDILIDSKPHLGTDVLSGILIKIRKHIISLGGEVSFGEKMTDMDVENGTITSVTTTKRTIESTNVILAAGHGARDVYQLLDNKNIAMEAKGFALGVRIEHPRELIDKGVYGKYAGHPRLGAASYNLKGKFAGRNVYSFCMCPGGEVINSSTETDGLCINGMSYNARDGINSNAAVVVQVQPEDWGGQAMDGIKFQRKFERLAFEQAGGEFKAPAQRFEDFKNNTVSKSFGIVKPTIKNGTAMTDLNKILGQEISGSIKSAISHWDRIIDGYSMGDAVLTGIESRTSSPVRVSRESTLQCTDVEGLYPCGEGAGYAGGIMSAAMDGIRCALAIINQVKVT